MKTILTSLCILMGTVTTATLVQPAHAQSASEQMTSSGDFTKKRYTVHGSWEIVTVDGQKAIKFNDAFKTKNGPDLKVFLSSQPLTDLAKKAELTNAVNIGVLKSNKGEQVYKLPEGVKLSDYKSVLIHCEAYSVLWGGFDIPG